MKIILYYIVIYLFIGVCLNLFYDLITRYVDPTGKLKNYLDDLDKAILVSIWPIGFLVFLQAFLKSLFYKK